MSNKNIDELFINECGFFGLNVQKISNMEMYPELDYSLVIYFDDSGIPCFRLKHRTFNQMQSTYENLIAIKKDGKAKILDINEYKSRRKK